ncbi:MAG: RNA 2',3'-cyclic phosphodiesterase [Alphaproteobacteria bacterium]|nr:MAG: RNA 2',3'-cyclic phosphodiesterase [Alphaproteobacteria bacterium]
MRTFLAIPVPAATAAELGAIQKELPVPRLVPPEQLHLTLVFLGDLRPEQLEEIDLALTGLRAEAFPLRLAGLGTFGGDALRSVHATVEPSEALTRLQAKLETAARRAGVSVPSRRFVPHVTLARMRPGSFDQAKLERRLAALNAFAARPFDVTDFRLYRSHLKSEGPEYDELARYRLFAPVA